MKLFFRTATKFKFYKLFLCFSFVCLLASFSVLAQEPNPEKQNPVSQEPTKDESNKNFEKSQINVIGNSSKSLKNIPGSATIVGKKFLEEMKPQDAMETLRRVPGVSVRYQDAGGLTPNIAFRGVSNEESRKTLILEDGVLTSLSPYGQPESYYAPMIERMERVEIVKGSGSILFGPSTIGGVVNFVTRKPPEKPTWNQRTLGGTNGYISNFSQYGGTHGNTSFDVSYLHKQGDGFRDFQGFRVDEINAKLFQKINESHTLTLSLGSHRQDAQSTYLGISQGMFWKNPRINPAQFDRKLLHRNAIVIGHEWTMDDSSRLVTKVYGTEARRDWNRQDFLFDDVNANGVVNPPPQDNYQTFSPNPTFNRPGDSIYMRRSTGLRNQFFRTMGVETKLEKEYMVLGLKNRLDFGIRFHREEVNVQFLQGFAPGSLYQQAFTSSDPVSIFSRYEFLKTFQDFSFKQSDQNRVANAYAIYAQNKIYLTEKLSIIPGIRHENIRQGVYTNRRIATQNDFNLGIVTPGANYVDLKSGGETVTKVWLPGLGILYDLSSNYNWFFGVHKGFSPPTYGTAISPLGQDFRLKAESSTNYETGVRGDFTNYLFAEATTYVLYFRNQIINAGEITAEQGTRPTNTGYSIHRGAELSVVYDLGKFMNWSFRLPFEFIYSRTEARNQTFTQIPVINNADGSFSLDPNPAFRVNNYQLISRDTNGNFLPYVPRDAYTLSAGYSIATGYYARLEYQYVGKQFSDLQNTKDESVNGSNGVIPAYGLVNSSFGFKHPEQKWSLFVNGKNLQDREYVSGRLPIGIQPGPFRQINFGISFEL